MSALTTPAAAGKGDGWAAVDGLLDDLDRLASSAKSEDEFLGRLLSRLQPLGCSAAAMWRADGEHELRLAWRSPGLQEANGEVESETQRAAVVAALAAGEPRWVDGPQGRSIVAPWGLVGGQRGALQVWWELRVRPEIAAGYLNVLRAAAEPVSAFYTQQAQRQAQERLDRQTQHLAVTLAFHESLDLQQTAYRIANDGRLLVGCDRVTVAVRRGRRYRVVAVSGAEHVHRRSPSVRELEQLCGSVAATGEALWQNGPPGSAQKTQAATTELAPQVASALAGYLDASPAVALAVIPLIAPPNTQQQSDQLSQARPERTQPLGALVFEQYTQPFSPATRESVASFVGHCRQALANGLALEAVPALQFWLALGRRGWLSKWAARGLIAAFVVAAMVSVFVFVPADIRIKARGELQPAVRHEIFAPRDGVVTAMHVDHGAHVKAGDLLLEIRSPELDLELQRASGELETSRQRLAAAQAERLQIKPGEADARLRERRLTAEEAQLLQQVQALAERQAMLRGQMQELIVTSPVSGEVITWDARQRLATRPLRRGDALLTVADDAGPWELELRVPSRSAGRLLAARRPGSEGQAVEFVLASDPGVSLRGTVQHLAERVEIDPSGDSYLLVTVAIPQDQLPSPVPGASAVARISCGRGSLGEAWFHELWDAARLWLPL